MNELKEYKEQFMAADDLAGEREVLKGLLTKMDVKFDVRPDGAVSAKAGKKANEVFGIFKKWASEKKDADRRADLTEEQRQAEDFDKQILGVGVAKNGKPYIKMPATLKAGETVQYKGVIFKTAGAGKVYQHGEIEIYNLYIEEEGWTATASGDYKFWNRKAVEEVGDYSRSFSRAMDDEGCVNYPSSTSLWAKVAESLKDQYIASERQIKVYLSSCGWGDYSPVEWTGSSKTPKDTFLAEARRLLAEGDADNPNQSDEALMERFNKVVNPKKGKE